MMKSTVTRPALMLLAFSVGLSAIYASGPRAARVAAGGQPARSPARVAAQSAAGIRPARLGMAPHIPGPRFDQSLNWSGYVVTGSPGSVSEVKCTWQVPQVKYTGCATNTYAATWCGIDGWSDGTVEQCGTMQEWLNGASGYARYYAWYEMYPRGSFGVYYVNAGDTMSADVKYSSSTGKFTLTIADQTTGSTYTTQQTLPTAQRSSAEWIEEAPYSGGILPLADFGQVNFGNCSSTVGSSTLGPSSGIPVTMVSQTSTHYALATPISASSTSCSIQWDACQ
jgi:peptidase A4-like protein